MILVCLSSPAHLREQKTTISWKALKKMKMIHCGKNLLVACILAFVLSACQKISPAEANLDLTSSLEGPAFCALTPSKDEGGEGGSKTAIDDALTISWTSGDEISVFRSATNEEYIYSGHSGHVESKFKKKDGSKPGELFSRNYAIYPYSESATCIKEGEFTTVLPSVQQYAESSFGEGTNLMTAATEELKDTVLRFKNVCGYIKLQLYGDETVKGIAFHGNNGEKIAGVAAIKVEYDKKPKITMSDGSTEEIILDCGEEGVKLGNSKEACTPFWIVVPPTTFEKGFSIDVTTMDGRVRTVSTDKEVNVVRNNVKRMAALELDFLHSKDILSFSLSDGIGNYDAFEIKDGIICVQVPNGTDMTNLTATFETTGDKVTVNGIEQLSGESRQNFDDFTNPVKYVVTAADGVSQKEYTVMMFDLPVMMIETPGHKPIVSKSVWIENTSIRIINNDNTITDLGNENKIKGRGNATWSTFPKHPYSIKISSAVELLDMKAHKSWALMAGWRDRVLIRDEATSRLAKMTTSLEWSPEGRSVELFLNGEFQGNYFLNEKIKIDKNRLNLKKLSSSDIEGEAVTGGYILEYDFYYDQPYKFKSASLNLPVNLREPDKDPSSDPLPEAQWSYIQNYINTLENLLVDPDKLATREYQDYLDIDSFIDWLFVQEIVGNTEAHAPASCYVYKDRNGKLKAGPVWDFEFSFRPGINSWVAEPYLYYPYLFKDPFFVKRVKEKWAELKGILKYNSENDAGVMIGVIDELSAPLVHSQARNIKMWPIYNWGVGDQDLDYPEAIARMKKGYVQRMEWLDKAISNLVVDFDHSESGTNEDFSSQEDLSENIGFGF